MSVFRRALEARQPADGERRRDARVFRIVAGILTAGQIVSPDRLHAATT
jgi:hypothetical protein